MPNITMKLWLHHVFFLSPHLALTITMDFSHPFRRPKDSLKNSSTNLVPMLPAGSGGRRDFAQHAFANCVYLVIGSL